MVDILLDAGGGSAAIDFSAVVTAKLQFHLRPPTSQSSKRTVIVFGALGSFTGQISTS
jgi:hypothetical protein